MGLESTGRGEEGRTSSDCFLFWERERCIQHFVELCSFCLFFLRKGGVHELNSDEFGPLKNDELVSYRFFYFFEYIHMQDFEIIPWINLFFSSLLHQFFPRSPCRKSPGPKPGVTGLQVFLVLPDEVSLNASSPRLRLWGWGKPSPTQDGSPEIFFFLTNFHQKKPKEW